MAFTSQLNGEPIFNDDTPDHETESAGGHSKGLRLELRTADGYAGVASGFPQELLIPRSEWQSRIQEKEERKNRISDLCDAAGLPVHDQDGIPYCWIHAPTHCVEIVRVIQNQPMVLLSATSAGAQIKNFRQEGGWGKEGLEFIVEHGVVPQSLWPENAVRRQYLTEAAKAAALDYRVTEWHECQPDTIEEMVSCLLRNIPVAIGLAWWGHEVTAVDAVWIDGAIAIRIDNSWGQSWGTNGRGILQGRKMVPDDAVCPRVAIAS